MAIFSYEFQKNFVSDMICFICYLLKIGSQTFDFLMRCECGRLLFDKRSLF